MQSPTLIQDDNEQLYHQEIFLTQGKEKIKTRNYYVSLSLYLDHEGLCSYWQQLYQEQALYH